MATTDFHYDRDHSRRRRADARQYWMLVCALYPLFLGLAVAARLMPRGKHFGSSVFDGGRSVFVEARIAAANCIPFILR